MTTGAFRERGTRLKRLYLERPRRLRELWDVATPGVFNTTNCPVAPFNQANCPQHTACSAADVINEIASQFLAQNIKSNTIEVQYDFNRRYSAQHRISLHQPYHRECEPDVRDWEFYFPGGAAGNAANLFLAARGDCALVGGALPAGCTQ